MHGHRDERRTRAQRARDRRGAILLHRPDHLAERGDLERGHQAREHFVDVGAGERELRRPEVEEWMAEGVDAVAVDVRDRPGRAQFEVPA
jgi:hypothetical protein